MTEYAFSQAVQHEAEAQSLMVKRLETQVVFGLIGFSIQRPKYASLTAGYNVATLCPMNCLAETVRCRIIGMLKGQGLAQNPICHNLYLDHVQTHFKTVIIQNVVRNALVIEHLSMVIAQQGTKREDILAIHAVSSLSGKVLAGCATLFAFEEAPVFIA